MPKQSIAIEILRTYGTPLVSLHGGCQYDVPAAHEKYLNPIIDHLPLVITSQALWKRKRGL
jgi:hypothetical protein